VALAYAKAIKHKFPKTVAILYNLLFLFQDMVGFLSNKSTHHLKVNQKL
jgi:hypothetical protein